MPKNDISVNISKCFIKFYIGKYKHIDQTRGPRLAAPWDLDSNLWRRESRSLGTRLKPQIFEFGLSIDPSGQTQLYHTPLLSKI